LKINVIVHVYRVRPTLSYVWSIIRALLTRSYRVESHRFRSGRLSLAHSAASSACLM